MANGLYTDISCFPYWLDCITEFSLRRGKNCFLQKKSATELWRVAEEKNLQSDKSAGCMWHIGELGEEGEVVHFWSLIAG